MIFKVEDSIMVNGHGELTSSGFRTLWTGNSVIPVMETVRQKLTLSSTSNNDTEYGTGAQRVSIVGLDLDMRPAVVNVILQGQTPVLVEPTIFLYINSLEVFSAGSSRSNEGVVHVGNGTVTAGEPATSYEQIPIAHSASHSMRYTVPAGKTLYINRLDFSRVVDIATLVNVVKKRPGLDVILDSFSFQTGDPSHTYQTPLIIRGGETVCVEAKKASGSATDLYCELYGTEK